MLKSKWLMASSVIILAITGCSSKSDSPKRPDTVVESKVVMLEREQKKVFDPVLRDNSPTQKAIVDMGVVLKVHVTSYKDANNNLIAGHEVFFWAIEPDFVTTNSLPKPKAPHSYIGPSVDLEKSTVVNTDTLTQEESTRASRENTYDERIEKFLHLMEKEQEKKVISKD